MGTGTSFVDQFPLFSINQISSLLINLVSTPISLVHVLYSYLCLNKKNNKWSSAVVEIGYWNGQNLYQDQLL